MAKMTVKGCTKPLLPVQDALELLSGKWKVPIIAALAQGSKRFRELQRDVVGITAKMLSKELKQLEMHQLVKRTVQDTILTTIEYSLTEYSWSLASTIESLYTWGVQHREKIIGASEVRP